MAPKTFFVRGFDELTGYLRMTQARRIMVVTSPRRRFVEPCWPR